MSKKEKLEKLNKEMLDCKKCTLRKTCTQVVPGEGNADAKIVFIGEGPGKKEDKIGRPFVGAAGKLLDEMLSTINLRRKDVYIANAVKCRPPKNRDPVQKEKDTCWHWLESQLEIIQPKIVVTLGRHSMNLFIPDQKISEVHGKSFEKNFSNIGKQVIIALYHPSAAICNGSIKQALIDDFKKIPKVLKKYEK
ncbi:uracil-DNA glycosylase [Patescibacteria group bacterium]